MCPKLSAKVIRQKARKRVLNKSLANVANAKINMAGKSSPHVEYVDAKGPHTEYVDNASRVDRLSQVSQRGRLATPLRKVSARRRGKLNRGR